MGVETAGGKFVAGRLHAAGTQYQLTLMPSIAGYNRGNSRVVEIRFPRYFMTAKK